MNSRAFGVPFREIPWTEIASRFTELAALHPHFQHMADIASSVIARHATTALAAHTSMHDLVVAKRPLPTESPIDVVIVKSLSSHRGYVAPGWVVIEHLSTTGHDDQITRPSDQAVPLFWRFMAEKFAITSLAEDLSDSSFL